MLKPLLLATLGLSVLLTPPALAATSASRDHVTVRVTTPQETVGPSGDVEIAVHYRIDPHWHIYWKNPGDSGAAPKFNIEGGTLQSVAWPYPVRLPVSEARPHPVTYGRKPAAALGLEPKAARNKGSSLPELAQKLVLSAVLFAHASVHKGLRRRQRLCRARVVDIYQRHLAREELRPTEVF